MTFRCIHRGFSVLSLVLLDFFICDPVCSLGDSLCTFPGHLLAAVDMSESEEGSETGSVEILPYAREPEFDAAQLVAGATADVEVDADEAAAADDHEVLGAADWPPP
jgi:hypothetical protein